MGKSTLYAAVTDMRKGIGVLSAIQETRSTTHSKKFLESYKGCLHTDYIEKRYPLKLSRSSRAILVWWYKKFLVMLFLYGGIGNDCNGKSVCRLR